MQKKYDNKNKHSQNNNILKQQKLTKQVLKIINTVYLYPVYCRYTVDVHYILDDTVYLIPIFIYFT